MTEMDEESARIRSYLVTQANKLSLPDLIEKVRRDVLPLRDAAAAIPLARFGERPAPDDWSGAEVWTHILQMNEIGAASIEGILDSGAVPPRIRDQISGAVRDDLATPEDYWRIHQERREQLLARAASASGDEHPEVKITHPSFGDFTWREWLLFMRIHDLDHTRQLQAIGERLNA